MIRVMSFNIRTASIPDGENNWQQRKSLVLGRIRAGAPDVLGVQECRDDAQAEYLQSSLPDYHFYGVRRGGGDETALEMAPILFRKASFQLLGSGVFWLSPTPQIPGSKGWDAVFARTAAWVELLHFVSGRRLIVLNTHLDYQPAAIKESACLLRSWAAETVQRLPLILTGDFNTGKSSAAYHTLAGPGRLGDALPPAAPGEGDLPTFHGFGQPGLAEAIDWILLSDHFKVLRAGVDTSLPAGRCPSDHFPVWAELGWGNENRPNNAALPGGISP